MLLNSFSGNKNIVEAGCDEAGRGCLAGPVVAAAVILPFDYCSSHLKDSKKLTSKKREILRNEIKSVAIAYSIGLCSPEEIDRFNILNCSFMAMHKALFSLNTIPDLILVDGNKFIQYNNIQHECIVKGDNKYLSIAAASVLAKTFRDELMRDLHIEFPHYHWHKNMGYPTKVHFESIRSSGLSPIHRKTFSYNKINSQSNHLSFEAK